VIRVVQSGDQISRRCSLMPAMKLYLAVMALLLLCCAKNSQPHLKNVSELTNDPNSCDVFRRLNEGQAIILGGVATSIYHNVWFRPVFRAGCPGETFLDWDAALYGLPAIEATLWKSTKNSFALLKIEGRVFRIRSNLLPDGLPFPTEARTVIYISRVLKVKKMNARAYQRFVNRSRCCWSEQ
jgi:hypothetical protein